MSTHWTTHYKTMNINIIDVPVLASQYLIVWSYPDVHNTTEVGSSCCWFRWCWWFLAILLKKVLSFEEQCPLLLQWKNKWESLWYYSARWSVRRKPRRKQRKSRFKINDTISCLHIVQILYIYLFSCLFQFCWLFCLHIQRNLSVFFRTSSIF